MHGRIRRRRIIREDAVAIHRRWRTGQLAAGKEAPSWSDLDESRKESNRAQARDMPVKLHSIGCTIAPLHDIRAPAFEFTERNSRCLRSPSTSVG